MRIGDWSSDVCSSDLTRCHRLMRPIHLVHLDKTRSALVLTRDLARGAMNNVTVAPITSTVKGLSTEVAIGSQQGVDDRSVISCDNIHTVPVTRLGRGVGLDRKSVVQGKRVSVRVDTGG